jgi:hypothetical protein
MAEIEKKEGEKEITKDEECKIATRVALRILAKEYEECPDALLSLAHKILGLDESNPGVACSEMLKKGVTEDICTNFRYWLTYRACKAWDLIRKGEAKTWEEALHKAKESIYIGCKEIGKPTEFG